LINIYPLLFLFFLFGLSFLNRLFFTFFSELKALDLRVFLV
jgi:hypothetical protein